MNTRLGDGLRTAAGDAFARRTTPGLLLAEDADAVANTCLDMAVRFHRGGRLVVFGNGGASADAQHITVEFVHPVIVGKRALPAFSLTSDAATLTGIAMRSGFADVFVHQIRHVAAPVDIALGLSADGECENVLRGLAAGRDLGMLTIGLVGGDGGAIARSEAVRHVLLARSDNPLVVKEIHTTIYHVLWELVHVFLEQPGLLEPGGVR